MSFFLPILSEWCGHLVCDFLFELHMRVEDSSHLLVGWVVIEYTVRSFFFVEDYRQKNEYPCLKKYLVADWFGL